MKDNRGFTLVEFIVVVAIMALMTSIFALSANTVNSSKVTRCSSKINAELSATRTSALSKDKNNYFAYMEVCIANDNSVHLITGTMEKNAGGTGYTHSVTSDEIIGNSKIQIKFYTSDSPDEKVLSADKGIVFTFDRSTGAFKELIIDEGDVFTLQSGVTCTKIVVTNSNRESVINLYPETGKHYVD